jgi:RNA polymerase sigma-70 factor (ECF subfamily)
MALTDEQLMLAFRNGDAAAFDQLYARYRAPLYRYVLRLCNDPSTVEELYQEVWLRVVRSRAQWHREAPFRPWLFGIAHNRVTDFWRSNSRRDAPQALDEQDPADTFTPGPDIRTLIQDCIERLKALLGRLPEAQRSAFLLKEEGGLTLEQIASCTGVGRETVKSRLRYALQSLRKGLEGCDDTT